jgi:hypothetical protein
MPRESNPSTMTMSLERTINSKNNILLKVKLKTLTMVEKDVDLWWDAVHDIVQKDIRKSI